MSIDELVLVKPAAPRHPAAHLFGTDELGPDLWSRVIHGSTLTL